MLLTLAMMTACSVTGDDIHAVTVAAGGDGASVAAEAAGMTLHAQALLLQQVFPSDDPRYQSFPAHHSARGWGRSRAEATRNAAARLDRLRALERKQHEHQLLQSYQEDATDQEAVRQLVIDLFTQTTSFSTVRVVDAQTRPPGAATVRFSDEHCGDPIEASAVVDGTGLDLLVDYACNQVLASGLIMGFESSAHASAEMKARLYRLSVQTAEDCAQRCLRDIVVD